MQAKRKITFAMREKVRKEESQGRMKWGRIERAFADERGQGALSLKAIRGKKNKKISKNEDFSPSVQREAKNEIRPQKKKWAATKCPNHRVKNP